MGEHHVRRGKRIERKCKKCTKDKTRGCYLEWHTNGEQGGRPPRKLKPPKRLVPVVEIKSRPRRLTEKGWLVAYYFLYFVLIRILFFLEALQSSQASSSRIIRSPSPKTTSRSSRQHWRKGSRSPVRRKVNSWRRRGQFIFAKQEVSGKGSLFAILQDGIDRLDEEIAEWTRSRKGSDTFSCDLFANIFFPCFCLSHMVFSLFLVSCTVDKINR